MQEYPAEPEEAFITSGNPAFSHRALRECFKREKGFRGFLQNLQDSSVKFIQDSSGRLTIFRAPQKEPYREDRYFVSGDPSYTVEGDPACIQVINRRTFEQVAVWHGHCDPITFADEMIKVGRYYNNAMLCPEVEGGGSSTIARLITLGYPKIFAHHRHDHVRQGGNAFGWSSNSARKLWAIGTLQRFVLDGSVKIHDRITYDQMLGYVNMDGNFTNVDPDVHDDGVMALAIAVTASTTQGPFLEDAPDYSEKPILGIVNQWFNEDDNLDGMAI
jgi:hypothetical protein